jgi:hypothetical protein
MASRSDNAAVQNLRARYRAQLEAVKAHDRRSREVQAAHRRLDAACVDLAQAEHREHIALAALAVLIGDVDSAAATVGTDSTAVTRARKAADAAEVRAEVNRLLGKEQGEIKTSDVQSEGEGDGSVSAATPAEDGDGGLTTY